MKAPDVILFAQRELTPDEYYAIQELYDEPDMMVYPTLLYRHGDNHMMWMHQPSPYEIRRIAEVWP